MPVGAGSSWAADLAAGMKGMAEARGYQISADNMQKFSEGFNYKEIGEYANLIIADAAMSPTGVNDMLKMSIASSAITGINAMFVSPQVAGRQGS